MYMLGTKIFVLICEVSVFHGENSIFLYKIRTQCLYFTGKIVYFYKIRTQSSVLINQASLFQRCPLREVLL